MEIFIPLIFMLLLIFLGIPVGYSMLIAGAGGTIWLIGFDPATGLMQGFLHTQVADFVLTTIPMFILMAEFLKQSGITKDIYDLMDAFLGHIRGGLAMATTIANGGMGALTGSSTATVAAISDIAVPEMRRYGYDDRLSIGTVAAAGTFGSLFPPSLGLIILGVLTETSIADLFVAAIIPGLLTVVAYLALISSWVYYNPDIAGGVAEKSSWKQRIKLLMPVWPALVLVALVLGGIYTGSTTPTEAGAVGAFGGWLVLLSRGGRFRSTVDACKEALELTVIIFVILLGAFLFSVYMSVTGFVQELSTIITGLPLPIFAIFMLILGAYIALGTIMDLLAILILTIPIFWPIVVGTWGYDPLWFGIVLIKVIEIGLVSPPLGLNVYVATSTVDVDADVAFKGAVVFILADLFVILSLFIYPDMVLIL